MQSFTLCQNKAINILRGIYSFDKIFNKIIMQNYCFRAKVVYFLHKAKKDVQ